MSIIDDAVTYFAFGRSGSNFKSHAVLLGMLKLE